MNVKVAITLSIAGAIGGIPISAAAQEPVIFDVSNAVVGASRIETGYLFAQGKWSDAGNDAGPDSTEIFCYKRLGFCDVASANVSSGKAFVDLNSYDILRWDNNEIIAVDSSAICVVNTLRASLTARKITLSSTDKGVTNDPLCKGSEKLPTAFLTGGSGVSQKTPRSKNASK